MYTICRRHFEPYPCSVRIPWALPCKLCSPSSSFGIAHIWDLFWATGNSWSHFAHPRRTECLQFSISRSRWQPAPKGQDTQLLIWSWDTPWDAGGLGSPFRIRWNRSPWDCLPHTLPAPSPLPSVLSLLFSLRAFPEKISHLGLCIVLFASGELTLNKDSTRFDLPYFILILAYVLFPVVAVMKLSQTWWMRAVQTHPPLLHFGGSILTQVPTLSSSLRLWVTIWGLFHRHPWLCPPSPRHTCPVPHFPPKDPDDGPPG